MENQIVSLLTTMNFAAIIFSCLVLFCFVFCGYTFSFPLCNYVGVESWTTWEDYV